MLFNERFRQLVYLHGDVSLVRVLYLGKKLVVAVDEQHCHPVSAACILVLHVDKLAYVLEIKEGKLGDGSVALVLFLGCDSSYPVVACVIFHYSVYF